MRHLSQQYQLCLEYMVNHVSPESEQYQEYIANGDNAKHAEMFVRWDRVWPDGESNTMPMLLLVAMRFRVCGMESVVAYNMEVCRVC